MANLQNQFREYLVENIRINTTLWKQHNVGDYYELGYSSEEEMESFSARYGGIMNALECVLETYDNLQNN